MALQESDHLGLRAFLASEAEKGSSAAESEESSEQTRPSSPAGDETEHSGGASEYDGGPPYTQRDVRYGAEDGGLPCTQRDVQYGAEDAAQTDSTVIARRVRTPAVAAGSHRKRPGDDVDTFVQRVAQRMKLKQSTMQELLKFSKLSALEREITVMATVLRSHEKLNVIQPAEAAWTLPRRLHEKIELLSADVLLCSSLSAYVKQPTKIVLDILERHPSWGFTREIKATAQQLDVVTNRVQTRLTGRRNDIKAAIAKSIGKEDTQKPGHFTGSLNIVQLVESAIMSTHKSIKVFDICCTVEMCGRFAFLRHVYLNDPGAGYWKKVDSDLEEIREKVCNNEAVSRYFRSILEADLAAYGEADVDHVAKNAVCTASQAEIDAVTIGDNEVPVVTSGGED